MFSLQLFRDLGLQGNVAHEVLVRDRPWRRWLGRICAYFRLPNLSLLGSTALLGLGFWLGFSCGGGPCA